MKRLLIVLAAFIAACATFYAVINKTEVPVETKSATVELSMDKVYLFTKKGCPYCSMAVNYIKQNHPDFQIEILDILESQINREMIIACANRFGIPLDHLGTPLICMPNGFILGWGGDAPKRFDDYVKGQQPQAE
ncbi:MAG: hypothetical protein J6Y85_00750 [Alphaproteobacteria bacterium]|nr:hypothetical protein [Alphaproteobacteria bacterium]